MLCKHQTRSSSLDSVEEPAEKVKKFDIIELSAKSPYFEVQNTENGGESKDLQKDSLLLCNIKMDILDARLHFGFFNVLCQELAKRLLGTLLVRSFKNGQQISARIVETEAYPGTLDVASHSYKGQTKRNSAMFMKPGTAYVYNIYGVYQCFNISSKGNIIEIIYFAYVHRINF